ncbi:hypothetical protein [Paractinoplanes lichenicola]|uniref:DUF3040 domain-containing protein n=1 Tax=Paractinoplanes lichenicola TaxID=2802976 RepID=A0ABS1VXE8_9ACTN|nr:hypothetical protein [Actinoplanes lichenicola]MBL7259162.1 hypothetical protein [Actinoplanes lichenicola]
MDRNHRLPAHVQDKRPAFDWVAHQQLTVNQRDVILHTDAEVRAWRAANVKKLKRHAERVAARKERDRRNRRFWTGFGAVVALVLLSALALVGWLLWTAVGLGVLAVPALGLLIAGLAVGGHRCVTIVQHMH